MLRRELLYFNAPLSLATLILMTRRLVTSVVCLLIGCLLLTIKDAGPSGIKFLIDYIAGAFIIESILFIIVESLVLHGVRNNVPCMLIPWIIFHSIMIILGFLSTVIYFSLIFGLAGVFVFFINVIIAGFNVFETIVVHHCYKELHSVSSHVETSLTI